MISKMSSIWKFFGCVMNEQKKTNRRFKVLELLPCEVAIVKKFSIKLGLHPLTQVSIFKY